MSYGVPRPGLHLEIKASTKAFEGFLVGAKFSILHAFIYAPYTSKLAAMENNSSRSVEYIKTVGRSSMFFCFLMSSLYGIRQFLNQNKAAIFREAQVDQIKRNDYRLAADMALYYAASLPVGICISLYMRRGFISSQLYTLLFAAVLKLTNSQE